MSSNAPGDLYRGYDRAALDREYDNQSKVGKDAFHAFLRLCSDLSERARTSFRCELDVPYGASDAEAMDLFIPDAHGPAPVEVFFHGGYWRMLDKRDFSYVACGFVPHGRLIAVVNYDLVPNVSLDELVAQCRRAMVWIGENCARFGGDPDRISMSGHSAGGHIVAMLLALGVEGSNGGGGARDIRAATALSGLYDLEPIRRCYLNDTLRFGEDEARRNSPFLLEPQLAVPFHLGVGRREGNEYLRQSELLVDAWTTTPCAPHLRVFDEDDHFSIRAQLGDPQSAVVSWMIEQRATHGG